MALNSVTPNELALSPGAAHTKPTPQNTDPILIVDDDPHILEVLSTHLEAEGYRCTTAESPVDALDRLKSSPFGLLITDLKMPDIDGIELVQHCKRIAPDVGILVVTGLIDINTAIQAIRSGADDYILKPFNLNEIGICVERAFEKRRLIIENRDYQEKLEERIREATHDLEQVNVDLRGTKEYLENLIDSTVDAIFTMDAQGTITFANRGALRMLGYTNSQLLGRPAAVLYTGGDEEASYIERVLQPDNPLQNYETELKHQSGGVVPASVSFSVIPGVAGAQSSTLAICKDITEQKRLERELKEMTIRDSLTALYNQRYFHERLEAEIERARRQNRPLSLLLVDVDLFKGYNDAHGHLEGDKVLQAVGDVLRECTREHVDLAFRYGGDEFTVILPEAPETQAHQIAERIRATFERKRFDLLTLSIGLMSYRDEHSSRNFVQFTDSMMYDAKRAGGNRVYVYSPED